MMSTFDSPPMPSNVNSKMSSGAMGRTSEFQNGKQVTPAPMKAPKVTKADITSDVS
jgi:hypothetical protein